MQCRKINCAFRCSAVGVEESVEILYSRSVQLMLMLTLMLMLMLMLCTRIDGVGQ